MAGAAASEVTIARRDRRFRGGAMLSSRSVDLEIGRSILRLGRSIGRAPDAGQAAKRGGSLSAWRARIDSSSRDGASDLRRICNVAVAQVAARRSVRDIVGLRRKAIVP